MFIQNFLGWLQDSITEKAEDALLSVLSSGPIPQHIAFIMDGNRRYAGSKHKPVSQGHADGFLALHRVYIISPPYEFSIVLI